MINKKEKKPVRRCNFIPYFAGDMPDPKQIADLRVDYALRSFDEKDLLTDPLKQFDLWMEEAITARVNEPNAMVLATVRSNGNPSARVVLLKGLSAEGFVFFTNYDSNKGQEIGQHPHVALVFCWLELQRQVRIEGTIDKVSPEESDAYFNSRPAGSRIGAHASPQSREVKNREELENRYREAETAFLSKEITRPENWGGYLVKPVSIEFWQGRQNRLHDRFLFTKTADHWKHMRLAP